MSVSENRNIALIFGWRENTVQRDSDGIARVSWFKVTSKTCVLYPGRCYSVLGKELRPMSKALEEEYRAEKKAK